MALYLKYRPQDFTSLVGQTFIKQTLQKAVAQEKTVGAYLFTGPRGTGKTSTARIFAKAINCETPKSGDPCGTCKICTSFSEGSLIDIVEIDAASHTGVDNIREIIEKAQFQPTSTKYKIYIIDEVHMLSKGAFNALLKILEEPPEHIKFILATTEIHKVPETILSRCQRYDFRNFSPEDLRGRLEYIAQEEKIEVDNESYDYIVKSAEGGMRNAVSLFEQLINDGKISYQYIVETLGIASEDEKKVFLEKLLSKDTSVMGDFETLQTQGKNIKNFLKELAQDLQKQTIVDIQAGKEIGTQVQLLDQLQDTLMKTKNSFDESMTISIGLLKILSNNPILNPFPLQEKGATEKKIINNVDAMGPSSLEKRGNSKVSFKKQEEPQKSTVLQEAQDIFASSLPSEGKVEKPSSLGGFDLEKYIKQVKTQGAKAAATMSLRGSNLQLDGETLTVRTKTQISLATLQKTENQEYMFQAAQALDIKLGKIEIL